MANNYTQFSEMLPFSTKVPVEDQKKWAAEVLEAKLEDYWAKYNNDPDPGEKEWFAFLEERGLDMKTNGLDADYFEQWPYFGWRIEDDHIWLYSEEGCELEHVAAFVQAFLKKFDPDSQGFGLQWADWCDKLRAGEFGGGAMWVTAKETRWAGTWKVLEDMSVGLYPLKEDPDAG